MWWIVGLPPNALVDSATLEFQRTSPDSAAVFSLGCLKGHRALLASFKNPHTVPL